MYALAKLYLPEYGNTIAASATYPEFASLFRGLPFSFRVMQLGVTRDRNANPQQTEQPAYCDLPLKRLHAFKTGVFESERQHNGNGEQQYEQRKQHQERQQNRVDEERSAELQFGLIGRRFSRRELAGGVRDFLHQRGGTTLDGFNTHAVLVDDDECDRFYTAAAPSPLFGIGAFAGANAETESDADQRDQGIAFHRYRFADNCFGVEHALDFTDGLAE